MAQGIPDHFEVFEDCASLAQPLSCEGDSRLRCVLNLLGCQRVRFPLRSFGDDTRGLIAELCCIPLMHRLKFDWSKVQLGLAVLMLDIVDGFGSGEPALLQFPLDLGITEA